MRVSVGGSLGDPKTSATKDVGEGLEPPRGGLGVMGALGGVVVIIVGPFLVLHFLLTAAG
jgi:hypothetical protein